MCDSDSEEFASADEAFEEIEPDELEEVLGSVKPSDVSSKKPSAKETSAKSDVDVVRTSTANANASEDTKTSPIKDSADENASTTGGSEEKTGAPIEEISKVAHHEDARMKEVDNLDAPTMTKAENDKGTESVSVSKPAYALQQPNVSPKDEAENRLDEGLKNDKIPEVPPVLQAKPPTQASEESVKPKKLILKPAKPQVFEEPKKPMVKKADPEPPVRKQAEPEATAEEGWDDFDDDWGDFNVDGGDGSQKVVAAKSKTDAGEEQRSSKASFKDVDIDDVEHKLKDFMTHKDDPPLTSVLDRLSTNDEKQSAGQSWGSWKPSWSGAAVSFLSTASKSVASITTNITQVIESGIGVPNPEDLARRQAEMEAKMKAEGYLREESEEAESTSTAKPSDDRFGFDQLVSGVTQISSKVITGGLDTLEGIGKKTMTILQENDPGLLNKRKLLGLQPNDGVILSQVLREAKAKTEERERNLKQIQKHQYKKKLHFETLFDDYHGLVHLEALEMLSKQAALKLESLMAPLTGKALEDLQETMSEVKELCELPDMDHDDADGRHTADELEAKLKEAIVDLDPNLKVDFSEILKSWTEYTAWIDDGRAEDRTAQDIFEKAMRALAQTTALCVLRMHKLAEILLISEHHSTATEADVVVQLTTVFCWHLSGVATRFCSELTKVKDECADESDNGLVTNIFLEGSNSTSYIQNAFQLFIPILQMGAA
ncbi:protein FAM114A2 [Anopheles ziemanni]|uniref:protein FAM114A2 n=1 Tax=Anopheles coustani TaxID=139045 RepID=UPI002659A88F|nr:protein FAM114A2 [Anopheles coustani]XP_058169111.1 protein FAM114A2 [Anopheles ziemanni]